ncbi:DNA-binding transcription factor [Lithospermum erythrorhizon]|uniref:DNA-binding transcription factor n=1 Tax=Lithospermum erythrorhizon TaxID=34254 RepID=A0AAV3QSN4_LITER
MAEFGDDEDWSLEAIVGGSNNMAMINTRNHPCSLGTLGITQDEADDQDFLFSFSDQVVKSPMHLDDRLEALYKPFYPFSDSITSQTSNLLAPKESKNDQEEDRGKQGHVETPTCSPSSKKRRNQEKRVVTQVKAEDLSSDMWAWRKYGQKPIKGSPYPRSYYRCSSMKGCLARKQVDQSCTDAGVYIVTYTEEHCHSQPTKRNSLAGTVRQKFPTPNIINGSFEEESNVKEENLNESDQIIHGGYTNSNELLFSDFLMNDDDFLSGLLEDLDEAS